MAPNVAAAPSVDALPRTAARASAGARPTGRGAGLETSHAVVPEEARAEGPAARHVASRAGLIARIVGGLRADR